MKKVAILMTAVFFAGITYGQISDPIPNSRSISRDTVPPGWNGDSTLYKKWLDSVRRANPSLDSLNQFDSSGRRNWDSKDSLGSFKNNSNWQDTSMSNQHHNATNQVDSNMAKSDENLKKESEGKEKASKGSTDSAATGGTTKTKKATDRVMMKSGDMILILNGTEEKMVKDYTFPDGTIVTPEGTVKMPDGKSVKLKDGQYIDIKKPSAKKTTTKKKTKTTKG